MVSQSAYGAGRKRLQFGEELGDLCRIGANRRLCGSASCAEEGAGDNRDTHAVGEIVMPKLTSSVAGMQTRSRTERLGKTDTISYMNGQNLDGTCVWVSAQRHRRVVEQSTCRSSTLRSLR